MRVRYIPQAQRDIRNISDWIARDSPTAAQKVENVINATAAWLGVHPDSGVATDHKRVRRRPIPKISYAIFYRIDWEESYVTVLRVVHGKQIRNLKRMPKQS